MSFAYTSKIKKRGAGFHHNSRLSSGAPIKRGGNTPVTTITATSVALWIFIGVATALFMLFLAAYVMRMDGSDWSPFVMPWQLWISTTFLVAASLTLHGVGKAARPMAARNLFLIGGLFELFFLGSQLWGWQVLQANHVTAMGNPAGSFFYLLTAMHGLHVMGGLVGWLRTARFAIAGAKSASAMSELKWRVRLCARYWDFLLLVWIVLFAALGWLTPELVRLICGTR